MDDNDDGFAVQIGSSILFCIVVVILGFVIYLLAQLPYLFSTLGDYLGNDIALGAIGTAAALLIGAGLYFLRKNRLMIYASLEIASAMSTAWVAVTQVREQGNLSVWVALVASASLVVAGIENIKKAKSLD